jgi:hypothetical protein
VVVYQYSCPVHGIVATSSIRRGAQRAIRCPACGADTETWIGPKIGLRTTEEPSPEEVYQYWEGTGWVNEVLVDGREVVDPSAVSGTPVRRASGPTPPRLSGRELRRRDRHTAAIMVLVAVLFLGVSVLYRTATAGSRSGGVAASAAAACMNAASAANEYGTGARSASSTRVVLTGAEQSLRTATRLYVGYTDIVRSVGALRDEIDAGQRTPSPQNVEYLNAVCGSPDDARV